MKEISNGKNPESNRIACATPSVCPFDGLSIIKNTPFRKTSRMYSIVMSANRITPLFARLKRH